MDSRRSCLLRRNAIGAGSMYASQDIGKLQQGTRLYISQIYVFQSIPIIKAQGTERICRYIYIVKYRVTEEAKMPWKMKIHYLNLPFSGKFGDCEDEASRRKSVENHEYV